MNPAADEVLVISRVRNGFQVTKTPEEYGRGKETYVFTSPEALAKWIIKRYTIPKSDSQPSQPKHCCNAKHEMLRKDK